MYRIILTLVLFTCSFSSTAQSNQIIAEKLDSFFKYCYDNGLYNGSVLISKNGVIVHKKSYGKLNVDSSQLITADTPFLLASISKQFTAFGIVQLRSKGLLQYDDQVIKYFPDFPYPEITIRHLLNHTSGLIEYESFLNSQITKIKENYKAKGTCITNDKIAAIITKRKPKLNFTPGTNFAYNNTGYIYLALLIEAISNKSYAKYVEESIFNPIGMTDSWVLEKNTVLDLHRAIGYKTNYMNNSTLDNEVPNFLRLYGDGGIYSSANDLQKWYNALEDETLIRKDELEEAHKTPIIGGRKGPYGFGWFVKILPFNNHKVLTHSGQFMGFTNSIFRDLKDKTTSIVLSNNSHKINADINRAVVRILYNMPYTKPKLDAQMVLGNILSLKGIKEAKAFYELHKENELYDFSEKSMNRVGYALLKIKQIEMAVHVFEWNVELNPESGNVYDSLGEAYLIKGNKEEALQNYQKAFKIDSSNTNAEKMIKKIKEG